MHIDELAKARTKDYQNVVRNILYRMHRDRVRTATSKIDTSSPKIRTDAIFNVPFYRRDLTALQYQVRRNTNMVMHMCGTQRIRSFTEKYGRAEFSAPVKTNISLRRQELDRLQYHNSLMGQRLASIQSVLKTKLSALDNNSIRRGRPREKFQIPTLILAKYKDLKLPRDPHILHRLLRPKIYLNFEVKNVLPLGRMIIQLFTEACPEAVLAFVRVCKAQQTNKMTLLRIFPSLWMEGEVQLEGKAMSAPKVEYDMRALDHDTSPGILSFSTQCLQGVHRGMLNFALSFKPLKVLNGNRVAFGIVRRGQKVLELLKNYGTKYGKLRQDVVISALGIVF